MGGKVLVTEVSKARNKGREEEDIEGGKQLFERRD